MTCIELKMEKNIMHAKQTFTVTLQGRYRKDKDKLASYSSHFNTAGSTTDTNWVSHINAVGVGVVQRLYYPINNTPLDPTLPFYSTPSPPTLSVCLIQPIHLTQPPEAYMLPTAKHQGHCDSPTSSFQMEYIINNVNTITSTPAPGVHRHLLLFVFHQEWKTR